MQTGHPHPKVITNIMAQSTTASPLNSTRASSVPILGSQSSSLPNSRPSSTLPAAGQSKIGTQSSLIPQATLAAPLDLCPQLLRSGPSVVKTRSGSVLSRGFILKTDHYPSGKRAYHSPDCYTLIQKLPGRALDLELNVHGAPNFRSPRRGNLNVFGVAQPRSQGLRAILSVLRCHPSSRDPSNCVWFSTREEPIGSLTSALC